MRAAGGTQPHARLLPAPRGAPAPAGTRPGGPTHFGALAAPESRRARSQLGPDSAPARWRCCAPAATRGRSETTNQLGGPDSRSGVNENPHQPWSGFPTPPNSLIFLLFLMPAGLSTLVYFVLS